MPMPWWIEVLQRAETWSVPPWEIAWDHGKVVWMIRQRIWSQQVDTALKDKRKHER